MADTPQNIQLRRFIRPIGVTGLGTDPDSRTERRLGTVSESFDGVLATAVGADPGAPPATLSYLTLAPLLAQTLASDERDARRGTASSEGVTPGDAVDDTGSVAPEGDEPRVRDLLSEDGDESASGRDLRPTDLTVSREPPRNAADEQDAGETSDWRQEQPGRSNGQSSLTGPNGYRRMDGSSDAPDWPLGRSVSGPTRTVVERSTHDTGSADTDPATASQNDWQASAPPDRRGSAQQIGSSESSAPTASVPTTVVHGRRPGTGESGAKASGPRGQPTTTEMSGRTTGADRGGPSLTITDPDVSGNSIERDTNTVDEAGGDGSTTRRTGFHTDGSDSDDGVAERTVIRSDGRLNERVFDRVYEAVSRKMRLERDREGR